MAKKSIIVRLVAESGSGTFYTTEKNPKMPHKLRKRMFDNKTGKHEWFEEKKIK